MRRILCEFFLETKRDLSFSHRPGLLQLARLESNPDGSVPGQAQRELLPAAAAAPAIASDARVATNHSSRSPPPLPAYHAARHMGA